MDRQVQMHYEDHSVDMANMEATVALEDVTEENEELAKRILVGKILTKKALNKGAVRAIYNTA